MIDKVMIVDDLKPLVKGRADLKYVLSGGIAVYEILAIDSKKYQLEIDLSDKHDVGETASFMLHYDRAIILMRWIKRANEDGTLICLGSAINVEQQA